MFCVFLKSLDFSQIQTRTWSSSPLHHITTLPLFPWVNTVILADERWAIMKRYLWCGVCSLMSYSERCSQTAGQDVVCRQCCKHNTLWATAANSHKNSRRKWRDDQINTNSGPRKMYDPGWRNVLYILTFCLVGSLAVNFHHRVSELA